MDKSNKDRRGEMSKRRHLLKSLKLRKKGSRRNFSRYMKMHKTTRIKSSIRMMAGKEVSVRPAGGSSIWKRWWSIKRFVRRCLCKRGKFLMSKKYDRSIYRQNWKTLILTLTSHLRRLRKRKNQLDQVVGQRLASGRRKVKCSELQCVQLDQIMATMIVLLLNWPLSKLPWSSLMIELSANGAIENSMKMLRIDISHSVRKSIRRHR